MLCARRKIIPHDSNHIEFMLSFRISVMIIGILQHRYQSKYKTAMCYIVNTIEASNFSLNVTIGICITLCCAKCIAIHCDALSAYQYIVRLRILNWQGKRGQVPMQWGQMPRNYGDVLHKRRHKIFLSNFAKMCKTFTKSKTGI